MKYDHVMIDLETLGTTADAVILSIGAVKFNLDGAIDDAAFYGSISIDSCLQYGRRISEDTLIWWMQQSREAQAVFNEPKETLDTVLGNFCDWFDNPDACAWANGPDFDLPMIAHAIAGCPDMEVPWKFWNSRCMRTYKSLPFAARVPKPANDHNALRDAVNQARYIQAVHAAMKVAA